MLGWSGRGTLWAAAWLVALFVCAQARPNFVVIMADDLGYGDMGFMGNSDVDTPNLDWLAAESVTFPNFYVSPVCTPTRASLLTGRNFLRTGVWGVHGGRDFLNLDESTFGNVLSNAGYATGLFGKWHNGKTEGYFPWQRGFNEACATELYNYYNNQAMCNGQKVYTNGWVQDQVANWAMDFISRKKDQSFVLYLPYMSPHLGRAGGGGGEYWPARDDLVQKYKNKGLSSGLSHLYGMIEMMDSSIGQILSHLDNQGVGDNTVVLFFSDNGATGAQLMDDWWRRNHHGLRGEKGQVTENGIRSPLVVRWRGSFPSGAVAQSQLSSVEDIFPTMTELAGTGYGNKPIDGLSLVPVLYNPYDDQGFSSRTIFSTIMSPEWTRYGGVYQLLPNDGTDKSGLSLGREGRWAVREGRWKLHVENGVENLYDIVADPQENNQIYDWSTIERLRGKLWNWWQSMVSDSGSFMTPSFYIGYSTASYYSIIPPAAIAKSGNWNLKTHHAEGSVGSGDYLKFKAIVSATGSYNVLMSHSGDWRGEAEINVSCGGSSASASGWVHGNGYLGNIFIPGTGNDCRVTLTIKSGGGYIALYQIWFQRSGGSGSYEFQSG